MKKKIIIVSSVVLILIIGVGTHCLMTLRKRIILNTIEEMKAKDITPPEKIVKWVQEKGNTFGRYFICKNGHLDGIHITSHGNFITRNIVDDIIVIKTSDDRMFYSDYHLCGGGYFFVPTHMEVTKVENMPENIDDFLSKTQQEFRWIEITEKTLPGIIKKEY